MISLIVTTSKQIWDIFISSHPSAFHFVHNIYSHQDICKRCLVYFPLTLSNGISNIYIGSQLNQQASWPKFLGDTNSFPPVNRVTAANSEAFSVGWNQSQNKKSSRFLQRFALRDFKHGPSPLNFPSPQHADCVSFNPTIC